MPQPNTPHSGLRDVNSLGSTLPPRSLFTTTTTTTTTTSYSSSSFMPATTHCLIARRELPGYHPQKWCALCTQANIPDPVTHVSETTEPHTPPLLDSKGQLTNPGSKESQREDLEKGELISLVEKLMEEASRSNIKIKSLQQDRDLIIQHREVFASALRIADRLIASKQRESIVTTKNQHVSALASTIDKHWVSVCQGSEYWKRWWSSGRPQHLRHTIRFSPPLGITPTTTATTGTDTTPPVIPTITAATGTDTTPTSPVTIPTVTNNTITAQGDTEETNPNSAGPATSPHPPPVASSTPTTRKHWGKRREKGKTRNPSQQQQGSKSRYPHTTNQQNTTQRPRQSPVKVCEYCKGRGHTVEDCHHRTADQRQERLLRMILAEGRHSDPPFPSAAPFQPNLPLQLNLPQSRPSFPQPDT
ncbi:hypothetical protein Pcinc_016631 [Petrolisthes cinctipes]|uniref:Uncharacterized protein n=1 Tax=Petrolisthes cinctipes TaxID=88211 RepID=A0AAE1FSJ0_PETCI|nr:hypothetical protein Pcinc_016631 [Petrolisthes cinctipes]